MMWVLKIDTFIQLKKLIRSFTLLVGIVLLSGCVGYNQQMSNTLAATRSGSLDLALSDLDKNNSNKQNNLLYYLEKGELLRMKGDFAQSRDSWLIADEMIRHWEESAKADPLKILGNVGSVFINDASRRYDGRDYEKVFVSVRLALDHLALGNFDQARTEIKKMHEREAIIAEFRAKDFESAKKESEKKGLKATSYKELNGYPVETLDDPQVKALKNSYESAFANYLAGFVYEALGEPSLAAAGYRKAIEMHPGESTLEAGLGGLDERISKVRQTGQSILATDTLMVVETGSAPTITSQTFAIALPLPTKDGFNTVWVPLSWPVIIPTRYFDVTNSITIDTKPQSLVMITNVDQMARRALSDEMPGIIFRSSIRAITKSAAQRAVQKNSDNMGMVGLLFSAAANVAALATENADERSWRTLPAFYSVSRAQLTPGFHTVSINTPNGLITREIHVSGTHAVVVLHTSGNSLYLAQPPYAEAANRDSTTTSSKQN
jgi:hypothetical protein